MLDPNRKHKAEIIGIRKEDIEKDIWPNTEAERGVET
jgi:hypothetical protein